MHEKKHILFLGLDHRMLWQLTRTLAQLEEEIAVDCVADPSAAKEICDREMVHAVVVDGWEQAWQAARHLAGDEAFDRGPWKWIVLVESLPLESLPAGKVSPSVLFLEKPFNPKEFPSFLMKLLEAGGVREVEEAPEPATRKVSLPLMPGETYKEPPSPPPVEESAQGEVSAEPPPAQEVAAPAEGDPFYHHLDQGFACMGEKDWKGAGEHWREALKIRPEDARLRANLRRLERMMETRKSPA